MHHRLKVLEAAIVIAGTSINLGAANQWKTLDSYQLVAGRHATAGDIGGIASGKLFVVGGADLRLQVSSAIIRVSDDDGSTWKTSDIFSVPNGGAQFHFRGFGAAPSGSLFVSGEAFQFGSGKNWIIRKSVDNGATWTTCDYLTEWRFYPSAADVKATQSGEIYAVGTYGGTCCEEWRLSAFQWYVRKSTDDGRTWQTVDTLGSLWPYNFSGARQVAFVGDAILVVGDLTLSPDWYGIEAWTVRRSLDRGATWATVDVFQMEVAQRSAAEAVATTPNGEILVAGWAHGGSGDSAVSYWVVRRSVDGGTTWQTVDSVISPASQNIAPTGIAGDAAGRIWVSGYSTENGIENGWLVRRGVPASDGTITWFNSDYVPGLGSRANAVWSDPQNRIFVAGRSGGRDGITAFTTRTLEAKAAAEDPEEDPFSWPTSESGEVPAVIVGPPINIAHAGDSLVVSWSALVKGAVLEFADVIPTDQWKPVKTLPFPVGNENVVLLDPTPRTRFFRLRQR